VAAGTGDTQRTAGTSPIARERLPGGDVRLQVTLHEVCQTEFAQAAATTVLRH
jgi:hypothetical protein